MTFADTLTISKEQYTEFVFNWLEEHILSLQEESITNIIQNCFEHSIKTLDCALYVLDKLFPDAEKKIPTYFEDQIIVLKSVFQHKETEEQFYVESKLGQEFMMLRTVQRNRKKDQPHYTLKVVACCILNKDYKIITY